MTEGIIHSEKTKQNKNKCSVLLIWCCIRNCPSLKTMDTYNLTTLVDGEFGGSLAKWF